MEKIFENERIYSVTELTRIIKKNLENDDKLTGIWIKGEISNLILHSSGHIYFSLKDSNAVISAVFFKNANRKLIFKLEDGMSVFAFGSITVYEKRGSYQISVSMIRLEGIGELQKKIEQLKNKLMKEGIFDAVKKKPIPLLPRKIGVVTSPTGAAFRDIVKVALRRFPNIEIILMPAKVQGDDADDSIVRGIEELNKPEWGIDVIIAGRGGGSFEDLMPFNQEKVVLAFFNSRVPIISAVGHQIDHPLCDDAADLAAPTPSAAAEIALPLKRDLIDEINYYSVRSNNAIINILSDLRGRISNVINRKFFRDPMEQINYRSLVLSDAENNFVSIMKDIMTKKKNQLLSVPDINFLIRSGLINKLNRFNLAVNTLEKLSPLGIMKRGFALPYNSNNELIRSVDYIKIDDNIKLKIIDGVIHCKVNSIEAGE